MDANKKNHVTAKDIAQIYGLSAGHVRDRVVNKPGFPSRLKYCSNPYRWVAKDVEAFFKETE